MFCDGSKPTKTRLSVQTDHLGSKSPIQRSSQDGDGKVWEAAEIHHLTGSLCWHHHQELCRPQI